MNNTVINQILSRCRDAQACTHFFSRCKKFAWYRPQQISCHDILVKMKIVMQK